MKDRDFVKLYWPETSCKEMCNGKHNDDLCATCEEDPHWTYGAEFTRKYLDQIATLRRELS